MSYFLDKDLPIIGRNDWTSRCLEIAGKNILEMFSKSKPFLFAPTIYDFNGKPVSSHKGETIKFRRYNKLKMAE
jgi:hypothetical protein